MQYELSELLPFWGGGAGVPSLWSLSPFFPGPLGLCSLLFQLPCACSIFPLMFCQNRNINLSFKNAIFYRRGTFSPIYHPTRHLCPSWPSSPQEVSVFTVSFSSFFPYSLFRTAWLLLFILLFGQSRSKLS